MRITTSLLSIIRDLHLWDCKESCRDSVQRIRYGMIVRVCMYVRERERERERERDKVYDTENTQANVY